jgi:hypothetical protein
MRDDMYKVIVERPRRGSRDDLASEGRIFRNSEDRPGKLGIKSGHRHRKSLNENLAPLRRFLESQIGRPWNKVYSELSKGIDRRNTVQEHIYSHLEGFVAIHTTWIQDPGEKAVNGQCVRICSQIWTANRGRLADSHFQLYVHPLSGLLLRNRDYKSWGSRQRKYYQKLNQPPANCIVVSSSRELHCIQGLWYQIDFEAFPPDVAGEPVPVWDALEKRSVTSNAVTGTAAQRYVRFKRQISSKEVTALK